MPIFVRIERSQTMILICIASINICADRNIVSRELEIFVFRGRILPFWKIIWNNRRTILLLDRGELVRGWVLRVFHTFSLVRWAGRIGN